MMSFSSSSPDPSAEDATDPHAPLQRAGEPKKTDESATEQRRAWPRRTFLGVLGAAGLTGGLSWVTRPSAPRPAVTPSPTSRLSAEPVGLAVDTSRGHVRVDFLSPSVARVRVSRTASDSVPYSYAVDTRLAGSAAVQITEADDLMHLSSDDMRVTVNPESGAIAVTTIDGVSVIAETATGYVAASGGFSWQIQLPEDESSYGLGERAFPLSLRGRELTLWNADAGSYAPGTDPLYLSVPFYLGVRDNLTYGLFWDSPARSAIDIASDGLGRLTFSSEQGPMSLYVITGSGPQQVVEQFAQLTGVMELIPLWALGYHQSRWSYRDEAHFRRVAERMRALQIPCDALHFDIDYMDGFRAFSWDRRRFPDPAGLLKDLDSRGFKAVGILNPGVKSDPTYEVFRSGTQRDVFLRGSSGDPVEGTVWAGKSNFPDFTKPTVRAWWSKQVAEFAKVGFAGFWNDMNEPATFDGAGKTLPDDVVHNWEGEGKSHVGGGHAVYGMQMARSTRQGLVSARPQKRPFILTRAGYAGVSRYATTWNGDSQATWEHLRLTIPQVCNLGISGIAMSGSDIGGFRGEPGAQLFLRWMQLGSMLPFFRTHSARTAQERNPWSYGEPTTGMIRAAIERRYELMPYFYTQAERAAAAGTPMVRPMFFAQPDDPSLREIDDQFMVGDDLLVAPILAEGATLRTVRLPRGAWYHYGTGVSQAGDQNLSVDAGWGLPLFVRAGAVIPTWPVRQSVSEPLEGLILDVYAGSGRSTLYEDAGDGYGYREGDFRSSTLTSRLGGDQLEVTWSEEGSFVRPYTKVDVRIRGLAKPPSRVECDGAGVSVHVDPTGGVALTVIPFQRLVAYL